MKQFQTTLMFGFAAIAVVGVVSLSFWNANEADATGNIVFYQPTCGIAPKDGRIIVDFKYGDEYPRLKNPSSQSYTKNVSIPAGKYKLTAVSFDGYSTRPNTDVAIEDHEQWNLEVWNGNTKVDDFGPTIDIPDGVTRAYSTTTLSNGVTFNQAINKLVLKHAFTNLSPEPHSVMPVCVAFDKIVTPPPAPVCTLSVSDSSINPSQSTRLTWTSTNASSFSINQGIGGVALDGNRSVSPDNTVTYVGTATNSAGETATCSARVTVIPPEPPMPVCTLSATDNSISRGETTKLNWTTTNGSSFSINQGIGSVALNGNKTVGPNDTITYTGTVTNSAGKTASCSAKVTVTIPAPTPCNCVLEADKTTIKAGEKVVLTWDSHNAVSATMNNGVGSVPVSGSKEVRPTETTTYTITIRGADGSYKTCTVTIIVEKPEPKMPICTLDAEKNLVERGEKVRLTWTSQNANSGTLDPDGGSIALNGFRDAFVNDDTTYTVTFRNYDGKTVKCSQTIKIKKVGYAPACTLELSAPTFTRGSSDTVRLSWTASNVERGFIDNGVGTVTPNGNTEFVPNKETLYTGVFTGKYGTATCSARITMITPPCTVNCGGGGFDQPRVEISKRDLPPESPLAFVYLSQVPYTGFPAGPFETALYWFALILISGVIAYYIIIKNILWKWAAMIFARGAKNERVVAEEMPHIVANRDDLIHAHYAKQGTNTVAAASFAPSNLPTGASEEVNTWATPSTGAPATAATPVHQKVEERTNREYMLLSPEALDMIIKKGQGIEADVLAVVEHVVEKAKMLFPREEGWILLNRDRILQIVPGMAHPSVPEAAVTPRLPHNPHVEAIKARFAASATNTEVAATPMTARIEKESASHARIAPDSVTVAGFVTAIAEGNEETAFGMLRALAPNGKAHEFLMQVIAALDDVYKNRLEGGKHVDAKLAATTGALSNTDLEELIGVMIGGVDYSYSSELTASKIAVAKAIEFFQKRK